MTVSRRDFLKALFTLPASAALLRGPLLHALFAPVGAGPRHLVLVELKGGCDGLNMVVPWGLAGGSYASEFRQSLAIPGASTLPLAAGIGLNPTMTALKGHYDAGRLAIVQGVGSPSPSFSHDVSTTIWESGLLSAASSEGWLARHLALVAAEGSGGSGGSGGGAGTAPPVAVAVSDTLPLLLAGSGGFVPAFTDTDDFTFPYDAWHWSDKDNRRAAYQAIADGLADGDGGGGGGPKPELAAMSATGTGLLELIDTFATLPPFTSVGGYPTGSSFSKSLKLVAKLMHSDLGMRYFHVPFGGWDTHADQEADGYHGQRLGKLSDALSAFHADLSAMGLADDTLVVVFSEFGRTVYQNGSGGTDHGTVNPVLVFGNGVVGGLTTEHPSMDPADLTEEDGELPLVTDFRDVFGTLVADWLGGDPATVFTGHAPTNLGFVA